MEVNKAASEGSDLPPTEHADPAQEDDPPTMFEMPTEIIQLIVSYLSLQGKDNWSKQSAYPVQVAFQIERQENIVATLNILPCKFAPPAPHSPLTCNLVQSSGI
jgi:hypothetical protein